MSKPRKLPFRFNPRLAAKKAKAWRIKRKGLGLPSDKASLRAIAQALETKPKPQ